MPPHTERPKRLLRHRKRLGLPHDGATNSGRSSPESDSCCVASGYDGDAGSKAEVPGISCCCVASCGSQIGRVSCLSYRYKKFQRVRRTVACMSILMALYPILFTHPFHDHLPRSTTRQGFERRPVMISLFNSSAVDDIGSWIYPSRPFPGFHAVVEKLKSDQVPDYGALSFSSLVQVPMEAFRRQIDPKDCLLYEAQRESQIEVMDSRDDISWDVHPEDREFEQLECRQPSWTSDYYPNCNSFHEVDLSRSYSASENEEYDSHSFR